MTRTSTRGTDCRRPTSIDEDAAGGERGLGLGVDLGASLLWQLAVTPLVYSLSFAVSLALARLGVVELGGSHAPWLAWLWSTDRSWLGDGRPNSG